MSKDRTKSVTKKEQEACFK